MIRKMQETDYDALVKIRKNLYLNRERLDEIPYRLQVQQAGFLLHPDYPKETFRLDLDRIAYVYDLEGNVVGFIRVEEKTEMEDTRIANWFDEAMEKEYYATPHAEIGGIAVAPEAYDMGVGNQLLEHAIAAIKEKHIPFLFSFVTLSPVTNFASITFHERHGFKRVASPLLEEFVDLKNYRSFLYARKI